MLVFEDGKVITFKIIKMLRILAETRIWRAELRVAQLVPFAKLESLLVPADRV